MDWLLDRHGAVGERRRRQPRPGESRADPGLAPARPGGSSRSTRRSPTCSRSRPTWPARWPRRWTWRSARPSAPRSAERPTSNAAAYDAFLKGEAESQSAGNADFVALGSAITLYERAVALDSGFVSGLGPAVARALADLLERRAQPAARRAAPWRRPSGRGAAAPATLRGTSRWGTITPPSWRTIPERCGSTRRGFGWRPTTASCSARRRGSSSASDRWEDALRHFRRAETLDPRSLTIARRITYTYLRLRRYPEAITAADRAIALSPDNAALVENKVMGYLGQGDLDRARELVRVAEGPYDPTAIATNFGNFFDLYWVLPVELQELLLRLTPDAFPDRATWGIVQAQLLHFRGDPVQARVYADSARAGARGAVPRRAGRRPEPRLPGAGPGLPGAEGGGDRRRERRRRAACRSTRTRTAGPTFSTSWCASTSWWVSRRRRSTGSSRCSRCRTISRPAGSGSIRTSIRSGAIRGSSGWSDRR